MSGRWLNSHRIFKRLAKALIRLRVCAGWSEPLLAAHTTLFKILCTGSNVLLQRVSSSIQHDKETCFFYQNQFFRCVPNKLIYSMFLNLTCLLYMYLKFENTNLPMAERAYTPNFSIKRDYNVFTRNTDQMCP